MSTRISTSSLPTGGNTKWPQPSSTPWTWNSTKLRVNGVSNCSRNCDSSPRRYRSMLTPHQALLPHPLLHPRRHPLQPPRGVRANPSSHRSMPMTFQAGQQTSFSNGGSLRRRMVAAPLTVWSRVSYFDSGDPSCIPGRRSMFGCSRIDLRFTPKRDREFHWEELR